MFDGIKSGNILLKNIHFFKVYHIIKVLKEVLYSTQNPKKNPKLYYGLANINANTFKNACVFLHVQTKTVFSITTGSS